MNSFKRKSLSGDDQRVSRSQTLIFEFTPGRPGGIRRVHSVVTVLALAMLVWSSERVLAQSSDNPARPTDDANPATPAEVQAPRVAESSQTAPLAKDAAPIPADYTLQAYDDCGIEHRQPHLVDASTYKFAENQVDAPERCRTVAFSATGLIRARYENIRNDVSYIVAVTYASEKKAIRRQTLHAGSDELHGPYKLPLGRAERCVFQIPTNAVQDGDLELIFRVVEGPNPVVSEIELWAPLPAPPIIRLQPWYGQDGVVRGRVTDLRFDPITDASVRVRVASDPDRSAASTPDADGVFRIEATRLGLAGDEVVEIGVQRDAAHEQIEAPVNELLFFPARYRPIAADVPGLGGCEQVLDGVWRIKASPEEGFESDTTRAETGWRDLQVPGQLVQQGLAVSNDTEFGLVREFDLPSDWRGRRVFLRFEAIHGETECFLNGERLGCSEFPYTPVEFDASYAARPGKTNRLALRLNTDARRIPDRLASSSLYAHHNLAGIHRSVRVFTLPETHIARAWIDPRVDETLTNGNLGVDLTIQHGGEDLAPYTARIRLMDPTGAETPLEDEMFPLGDLESGENRRMLQCRVQRPLLWSAEIPHLYTLELTLMAEGRPLETIQRNVGFRRVEVQGNRVLVNGKPIKLAGANRHEIDPLTGRANTARHAERDAQLFKGANCNYVRTSHYPPTREFLDACDRIGLYVECEAPFCWTHKEPEEDDPRYRREFLHPTASMLEYHHAHPSIIFWSLGNESGWNKPKIGIPSNYEATNAYAKRLDPARPTVFNNSFGNDGQLCDVAVTHYPPADDLSRSLVHPDDPRPILIDEFVHVMCYNVEELRVDPGVTEEWARGLPRFGASDNRDFWDPDSIWNRIYNTDRYLGLAIWGGIDEMHYLPDGKLRGYGPWGLIDGWRRPKAEWWHTRMMYAPVWIRQRRVDYDPEIGLARIPIENRYSFIDLSELTVHWRAADSTGWIPGPAISPLSHGKLDLEVPAGLPSGTALELEFVDRQGTSIVTWGLDLGERAPRKLSAPGGGAPHWEQEHKLLHIVGDDYRLTLDTETGRFIPDEDSGTPLLKALPTIHATQAERRMVFTPKAPAYLELPDAGTRSIESVDIETRGEAIAIILKERYEGFAGSTEWLLDRGGAGVITYDYTYAGPARELREVGVKVTLDTSCQTLRWNSRGLWGVYPDDHIGRPAGAADARRAPNGPSANPRERPTWPWSLDENDLGTRDFRSTKFNIYGASLVTPEGGGLRIDAEADANVRACLCPDGVALHLLDAQQARGATENTKLIGRFHVQLIRADPREQVSNAGT